MATLYLHIKMDLGMLRTKISSNKSLSLVQSQCCRVFISIDSGTTFKPLVLKSLSSTLRSALNFPETDLILTLHGDQNSVISN